MVDTCYYIYPKHIEIYYTEWSLIYANIKVVRKVKHPRMDWESDKHSNSLEMHVTVSQKGGGKRC